MIIGELINGLVVCRKCVIGNPIIPIHISNISPYSQQCAVCHELLVVGWLSGDGSPLNLFQLAMNDLRANWYERHIQEAVDRKDWETAKMVESNFHKELLESIKKGTCRNQPYCITKALRWLDDKRY